MKSKVLYAILILSVVLITCKKEPEPTPQTSTTNTNNTTATCSDGIQNGTETGIDCGGSCPACPTSLTSCAGDEVNLMFGKLYGQIADTSSLGANPNWLYPNSIKYFSVYDSSSADWIMGMCNGTANSWQNWNNELAYYFQAYYTNYNSTTGVTTFSDAGKLGYMLRNAGLASSYGEGCVMLVGMSGLTNNSCPIFDTYPADPDAYQLYNQYVHFTDSIYVIDIRLIPGANYPAPHVFEYHRDTLTYYLVQ